MKFSDHDVLMITAARDAVRNVAPEELAAFELTAEAFVRRPNYAFRSAYKDEALGFGIDSAVVLIAPVALAMAKGALDGLGYDAHRALRTRAKAAMRRAFERLFERRHGRRPSTNTVRALTLDQLAAVRAQSVVKARQLGLNEQRAHLLADALVGSLATQLGYTSFPVERRDDIGN